MLRGSLFFCSQVTDSSGHLLYSREEAKKGKFAFTTEDYEVYEICFQSHGQPGEGRQLPDYRSHRPH